MFKVKNSLNSETSSPLDLPKDKVLKWYTCGPTIYSDAHLGHARTFITFDIIRRILKHKGYMITYVMNITDLDDKILNKIKELNNVDTVTFDVYHEFIQRMEKRFWDDCDSLNIVRPDVVTRVSEYIPKIQSYISTILDNGFAYISNNSIYFDSQAFIEQGYDFAPLTNQLQDETKINTNKSNFVSEKKHPSDFALWKGAKQGEISYPFVINGNNLDGRPGWHIECSVMSTDILGSDLDIHSGGVDLAFPHHNNEIVQVVANKHNHTNDWTKFFLHSGHLHIDGEKMAKSLGNFITIRSFLEKDGNTAQHLRITFLYHRYNRVLNYTEDIMEEARHIEKKFDEFDAHIKFTQTQDIPISTILTDRDIAYQQMVLNLRHTIDNNLLDDFDTPSVMKNLLGGISKTYVYMSGESYNFNFVIDFYGLFRENLELFGLVIEKSNDVDTAKLNTFVKLGVDLREDVRTLVKNKKKEMPKEVFVEFFKLLDHFRDVKLKDAGVELQDRGQGQTTKFKINI